MPNKDLRDWISGIEAAGELKFIKGAEPKEEIGAFVDIYQRKMGNPALMFDEIPGFPKGHRVPLSSCLQASMALLSWANITSGSSLVLSLLLLACIPRCSCWRD
jgi:3-polyprenyl-4-hydroxybenzoate decarboxylase